MSVKPISMNIGVPIQKSMRFFIIMFPAFFARVKPVSTIAKPHCIKNTRAAPIKNHTPQIESASIKLPPDIFILPAALCRGTGPWN